MSDINIWLRDIGLEKYAASFVEAEIDFATLHLLTEDDLRELGLPIGPRRKILNAARRLAIHPDEAAPQTTKDSRIGGAERRQLTVVFCDLVDSTALLRTVDPEDLREILQNYHEIVTSSVRSYGGFIAKYLGDGILAYFGYPTAQEDAAERAIEAGLAALASVRTLVGPNGQPISVRIGIATGPVIVGDVVGEDLAKEVNVIGETPNLAARLLSSARPNTVVIAEATRRLVGNLFRVHQLGGQNLKGFDTPQIAFEVLGREKAESRFQAVRASAQNTLIGREREAEQVLRRWMQAKTGSGSLVLVSGEAGIGKSHFIEACRRQIESETSVTIRYQCSSQHSSSPFHPIIAELAASAGIDAADDQPTSLAKLDALLKGLARDHRALVANLFGEKLSAQLSDLPPARHRAMLLEALAQRIEGIAKTTPVLVLIEDVHWIDPSTSEFVETLIGKAQERALLMLATARPDYISPWSRDGVAGIELQRLSPGETGPFLALLSGGLPVSEEVVAQIAARTDGIPLYVEEMFRALLDGGFIAIEQSEIRPARPLQGALIPASLQDTLMARLDRTGAAKIIAQIGSVIGREFDHRILEEVAGFASPALTQAVSTLADAGLISVRQDGTQKVYAFRHALIQDTAYGSLLRERRRELHAIVLSALERQPQLLTNPELLAGHSLAAGLHLKAVRYLRNAAQLAHRRSAYVEAAKHIDQALQYATPANLGERDALEEEVELRMLLHIALGNRAGFATARTGDNLMKARIAAEKFGDSDKLLNVLQGVWAFFSHQGRNDDAVSVADRMVEVAQACEDPAALAQAYQAYGANLVLAGRLREADEALSNSLALAHGRRDTSGKSTFLTRVIFNSNYYLSMVRLLRGQAGRAAENSAIALDVATQANLAGLIAQALECACNLHQHSRNWPELATAASRLVDFATTKELPFWLTIGQIETGWAEVNLGRIAEGTQKLREGVNGYRATGTLRMLPSLLAGLAEALVIGENNDEALATIDEARKHAVDLGHRILPEVLRIRGVILARQSPHRLDEIEWHFNEAFQLAKRQGSLLWQLRSSCALARLPFEDHRRQQALDLLRSVYSDFSEGFDSPDLVEARSLMGLMSTSNA